MIEMILRIDDLQATAMLPTKFLVNWPFVSGEEKNTVSRWPGIQIGIILAIFDRQVNPILPTNFLPSLMVLLVQEEKRKIDL